MNALLHSVPLIREVHVACVLLSGTLFTLRGVLMLARSAYTNHRALRVLSSGTDTLLLLAALLLLALLRPSPLQQSWLQVKLVLVCVYIALGVLALRRGRSLPVRAGCFAAALAVYGAILSIALSHSPLGLFGAR